ncbi:MAG: hypothetical protein HeimC3_46310 [Candidatus Heimdallarchaeota archaeon LC_3]|nr:MAG: hypothetical protein HeimC3_46310 [Candidatus Heimdallarchaeota archaeon LC_3]
MRILYIDTNVLLARWIKDDPFHNESVLIISAIENNQIKAYFSTFGLCEIVSVVKRQEEKFSSIFTNKNLISLAFLKKVRKIKNINIFNDKNILKVNISGQKTEISLTYWTAINIGAKTGLKTLDNIHIALSRIISTVTEDSVDFFITGDSGILQKAKEIKKMFNISVIDPSVLVKVEGL